MKFIFATHNQNKVNEVADILKDLDCSIHSLRDIGFEEDIEEHGLTLEENAWIKADTIHGKFDGNVIAEDTGLEVMALKGAPGVYSARYAGPQKNSEDNIDLLLENLKPGMDRSAQFRTVIAVWLEGQKHQFEGVVKGVISNQRSGKGGFGYDPVFIPDGYDRSFGEISAEIKNRISHRAKAFDRFQEFISSYTL